MVPVVVSLRVTPQTNDPGPTIAIRGTARNCGTVPLDLELHKSELSIDGEASPEWRLAIGNGARYPGEDCLPPGERLEFGRDLGPSILRGAGPHVLTLRVLGVESPPVTLSPDAGGGEDGVDGFA